MQTRQLRGNNVRAARRLRRELTPTEELLWEALRDRRLDGYKFRRQHPVGRFVLDFYCGEVGLAVEVDGGIHDLPAQRLSDLDRQEVLEEHDIRFLRIRDSDITERLLDVLSAIVAACNEFDSPSPRARGEGVGG